MKKRAVFVTFLSLTLMPAAVVADEREEMRLYMQGSFVYQRHCADCHGKSGKGDGPLAADVKIRPRDFRKGVFKFRSTPMGFMPTEADLTRTIRSGVTGSLMPAFGDLTDREVQALVVYIKAQSGRWRDPKLQAEPIKVPEPPKWFKEPAELSKRRAKGKAIFARTCVSCHGESGRGDGVAAKGLLDHWGAPIVPVDFTNANRRSGPRREDMFRTVATGLDGTPMVGYLRPLGPEAIWEVVAYVESLVVKK